MRQLYNTVCPVIAMNGPDHETTQVMGLAADIGMNGVSLHFYRDKYTPSTAQSIITKGDIIPKIEGFKHTRK